MNAKDRYNNIIALIEEQIQEPYLSHAEIAARVARSAGLDGRNMNTVMSFLTDQLLKDYIRDRRLMAAYCHLVLDDEADIATAIELSGRNAHAHFDNDFKRKFHMTPKEAKRFKDESLIEAPLTWEKISCETPKTQTVEEVEQMEDKKIYGMSLEQYQQILAATELSEFYGLEPNQSNIAFDLASYLTVPLEKAFRYVSEICELFDLEDDNLSETAHDKLLQFLFFQCAIPVDLSFEVMDRITLPASEIIGMEPGIVSSFAYTKEMKFSFYMSAVEYYKKRANEDYDEDTFEAYIDYLSFGVPMETAFERLIPMGNIDAADIDLDHEMAAALDDSDSPFEDQARTEAQWMGQRIDMEYDPDNPEYNNDEKDGYFDF